ncbi:MAG: FKBP-type peptidyl-prolyl cis-trans isomerase [Propionibacteriaceae bacterium]|nr:FKBP-type peptidyl-prolyl cis-trans isomerase [Propionibacteriaceae bacterium]
MGACGSDSDSASSSASPSAASSVSGSASASESAAKIVASTNLDKITVSGDYGKSPKVDLKAPWAIDKTRTRVVKATDGAVVKAGQTVEVNYYGVNGRTGKKFDDSYSRGQSVAFNLDQVVPGFKKGLVGQKQGSRVLVAMPGSDGYDASGGSEQTGIKVGDSLVFVIDVVAVELAGPEGAAVAPKAGLPTVTDKNGVPEITVPKTDPPTTLQVQPLIKGSGKKVGADDTITMNYRWVAWRDGRLLEETYSSKPASAALTELLPGLQKGLVNQTVGSRVLVVVPPADGYPQGNETPKVDPGETVVLVVDLLFTQAAQ